MMNFLKCLIVIVACIHAVYTLYIAARSPKNLAYYLRIIKNEFQTYKSEFWKKVALIHFNVISFFGVTINKGFFRYMSFLNKKRTGIEELN